MPQNPLTQVRLNTMRFSLEQLKTTKDRLRNELFDAIVLKNFVFAVAEEFSKSHDDAKALEAGKELLKTKYPDDPNTPRNEAVTFQDVQDFAKQIYKDHPSESTMDNIVKEAEAIDFTSSSHLSIKALAHGENPNTLALKILKIIGQRSSIDSQITDTNNDINDLVAEAKSS